MVRVQLIDGQLKMQLYFRDDVPVADAKGYWRAPNSALAQLLL